MSRGGSCKLHHLSWLWRAPRRALGAARDFYVRSLTGCAGHIHGDAAFGYPTFGAARYGGEFSFASSSRRSSDAVDDDLRELIRAASQRDEDIPTNVTSHGSTAPRQAPTMPIPGPITRSRAKKLQQEVYTRRTAAGPEEMSYTKKEMGYTEAEPTHMLLTQVSSSKSNTHQHVQIRPA